MDELVGLCRLVDSVEDRQLRESLEKAVIELLVAIGREKIIDLLDNNNK